MNDLRVVLTITRAPRSPPRLLERAWASVGRSRRDQPRAAGSATAGDLDPEPRGRSAPSRRCSALWRRDRGRWTPPMPTAAPRAPASTGRRSAGVLAAPGCRGAEAHSSSQARPRGYHGVAAAAAVSSRARRAAPPTRVVSRGADDVVGLLDLADREVVGAELLLVERPSRASLSSVGCGRRSTRPVVIVTFLIHRSSRCSAVGRAVTPMLATRAARAHEVTRPRSRSPSTPTPPSPRRRPVAEVLHDRPLGRRDHAWRRGVRA